MTKCI